MNYKPALGAGLILLISFLLSLQVQALRNASQDSPKKSFGQRLFVGGSLGFGFGTYSSLVDVSPLIGYAVTNDWVVGIGLTYKYYRYKDYYYYIDENGKIQWIDFKTNMYGASIWTRYFLTKTEIPVIENIFLHAEVEPLMFVNKYKPDPSGIYRDRYSNSRYAEEDDRINVTGYFLGGGLRQLIGGRSYVYLELLWNFNDELYSPYSNPRIRVGIAAGF